MAGVNMVAAKQALVAALKASPSLTGVQVEYAWPGRTLEREVIYCGKTLFQQDLGNFRPTGGRLGRDEHATTAVHVVVRDPAGDPSVSDQRAVALGTVLEELLAGDPQLGGLLNLLIAIVVGGELAEPSFDDDGVLSALTYEVLFRSYLH